MLVYDAETNGLYDEVSVIHCINCIDRADGKELRFNVGRYADGTKAKRDGTIEEGLQLVSESPLIGGVNNIQYDNPVFAKLHPGWEARGNVFDARVATQLIYTDLIDRDMRALRRGRLPEEFRKKGLIGRHSLEAWGYRLDPDGKKGLRKTDSGVEANDWSKFTKQMDDYGMQDVRVTRALIEHIESKAYSPEALHLEHRVAEIINRQMRWGFAFDTAAAEKLYADLQKERVRLEDQLHDAFPPWEIVTKRGISKVNNKKLGRVKGEPYVVKKMQTFNPGSRDHIADRLQKLRGWRPDAFTPNGKPKVDEAVLASLDYPEAKLLSEYFVIQKRLGQIGDGQGAWLKLVKDGRIHGSVNTNGAVTGRMTHSKPNVAQVDKHPPMRACWTASEGRKLVGCDAEGLELRMLGHYMAIYDGGDYARSVVEGKKEDGTDVHTRNQKAVGLNTRDAAKTFIYAFLYGAGDYKLGTIIYDDFTEARKTGFDDRPGDRDRHLATLGKKGRDRLMGEFPALKKLVSKVKQAAKKRGWLRGLDGRRLHVRSQHAALNTLLQSAGAVVMKKALEIFDDNVRASKVLRDAVNYCANVHDEFQLDVIAKYATRVGKLAADSIRLAGEHFNLNCPLSGSYDIGTNWAETH